MNQSNNSELYQYHVDFSPIIDNIRVRKRLLNEHQSIIGNVKAFDGMVLFCARKLNQV